MIVCQRLLAQLLALRALPTRVVFSGDLRAHKGVVSSTLLAIVPLRVLHLELQLAEVVKAVH